MRQYHILQKNNKVNCCLLLGILMLENLVCLERVCICLYFIVVVILRMNLQICCINMSIHALVGRPAARLEMMALVFSSYLLVCVVDKRRVLSLYGCNLLIYVMILPCSLQKMLTRNQALFNVLIHVRTYHSKNLTKVSYLVQ